MRIREKIKDKLEKAFQPEILEITDESHKHEGHAGHDGKGESHFRVTIVSNFFADKSRIERQRMIYGVLHEEMQSRIHALSLKILTPDEVK